MLTRKTQLSWFEAGSVIHQDQQLVDLIQQNHYTKALGYGDIDYFKQYINIVESGPVDFCIYIENCFQQPYNFNELIDRVNYIIKMHMNSNGLMYLSINRYLAQPGRYAKNLSKDYDCAILEFVSRHVNARVERYFACGDDGGTRFNWAHPLTRFYLRCST